jgi:hypothetical protein
MQSPPVPLWINLSHASRRRRALIVTKDLMQHSWPPLDLTRLPGWEHEQLPTVLDRRVAVEEEAGDRRPGRLGQPGLAAWRLNVCVVLAVVVGLHAPGQAFPGLRGLACRVGAGLCHARWFWRIQGHLTELHTRGYELMGKHRF